MLGWMFSQCLVMLQRTILPTPGLGICASVGVSGAWNSCSPALTAHPSGRMSSQLSFSGFSCVFWLRSEATQCSFCCTSLTISLCSGVWALSRCLVTPQPQIQAGSATWQVMALAGTVWWPRTSPAWTISNSISAISSSGHKGLMGPSQLSASLSTQTPPNLLHARPRMQLPQFPSGQEKTKCPFRSGFLPLSSCP